MTASRRHLRVGFSAWLLVAAILGQALFLPTQAGATGEVGRPPLPYGIRRLPFDGAQQITQVPGCGEHTWKDGLEKKWNEMNSRAFDFGLPEGTQIVAAGSGWVLDEFDDPNGSKILVINHGSGKQIDGVESDEVRSYYVHVADYLVSIGEPVVAGQPIAVSGQTGAPGQPHLHFAVTVGGDPSGTGVAANINDLPGIPWDRNQMNGDGFVTNCGPTVPNEVAVGGAMAPMYEDPNQTSIAAPVFDGNAAAAAAYSTFNNGDEFGDDSANFVSQALWAGNLPRTDGWDDDILSSPDNLANYLIGTRPYGDDASITLATEIPLSWTDNTANGAQLGDVIAYDYEGDGTIDHVAIVTSLNEQNYPSVTEHSPSHQDRFWTYSEEAGAWIAEAHPGAVAYLIKIAPMTVPNF